MKAKLLALLAMIQAAMPGLQGEEKTKAEGQIADLKKELDALPEETKTETTVTTPTAPPANAPAGAGGSNLEQKVDTLTTQFSQLMQAFGKMEERAQKAEAALVEEQKATTSKKIEDKVATYVSEGRIPNDPEKIKQAKEDLAADFDRVSRIIDQVPANKALSSNATGGTRTTVPAAGAKTDGAPAKQYTSKFAASIPKEFMTHVEQDSTSN